MNDYAMRFAQERFEFLCNFPSDINLHLPTILSYAKQCDHVTEMGVRGVVSTWALIAALPKKIVCYDIVDCPIQDASLVSKDLNIDFNFIIADTVDPNLKIDQTDLLFIDTWHVYDQLKLELEYHNDKVNKYIIMHDTTTFADIGEMPSDFYTNYLEKRNDKVGLWPAIEEFLYSNRQWRLKEKFDHNNGLTILQRIA